MEIHEMTLSGEKAKEFARMMGEFASKKSQKIEPEIAILRLKDHFADWAKRYEFKPGDIVRFKPGFHGNAALSGSPAIVLEVLKYPIIGDSHGSGNEYGASLDLRIGALSESGVFAMALFESAVFEPWTNGSESTQP